MKKRKTLDKPEEDTTVNKWHKSSAGSHLRSQHPALLHVLEGTIEAEIPVEKEKLQEQTLFMMRYNCRRQKGNLWLKGDKTPVCFCSDKPIIPETIFKHIPQPPPQSVVPPSEVIRSSDKASNKRYSAGNPKYARIPYPGSGDRGCL